MKLFYIPCKDIDEAKNIAIKLLEERLVFCTNIIDKIETLYIENNKINNANEVVLILKANAKNTQNIHDRVKQLHSYDIPAIIDFSCNANSEFLELL